MRFCVARSVLVSVSLAAVLAGCNDNGMAALPGSLRASPSSLDYGLVKEETTFSQTVVLSHEGNSEVKVTGVRFDPPDAMWVFDDPANIPTEAAPWTLRRDFRALDLSFAPTTNGTAAADLIIESNDPSSPLIRVPLTGHGYHTAIDDFSQGGTIGGEADILFVVDNSGSMSEEQTKLGQSFSTFINWLTGGQIDYHVAITTTDMFDANQTGKFVAAAGNPKVLTPATANVSQVFAQNVNVGANGSGDEKGLDAATTALSPTLLAADNAGFLRNSARLYVVWVTDEEDSSSNSPSWHQSQLTAVKGGDPGKIFFAAIAGPEPLGCFNFSNSADAGTRYIDIVDATNGLFGSICDADFGVTLQNLAFEVTSLGNTFPLGEIPDPTTIQVLIDGIPQATTTWIYSAPANAIQFVPGYEPATGTAVTVTYDVL